MRAAWRVAIFLVCLQGCVPLSQERVRDFNEDGVYLFNLGEYTQARDSFQTALELKPADAVLLFNIGQCYDRLDDPANAEKAYNECLQLAPNHADCRHALASLLVRVGRKDDATRMVQAWLASQPKLAAAYAEDGWLLQQSGDLLGAQARLHLALDLDPHDTRALVELARVYEAMQRPDRAVALYERVLLLHPREVEIEKRLKLLRAQGVGEPHPD
jgi:Flp pilus assembly protein TadD